jgi:hypothetical protein
MRKRFAVLGALFATIGLGVALQSAECATEPISSPDPRIQRASTMPVCAPSESITFDIHPGALVGNLPQGFQAITIDQQGRVGVVVLDGGTNIPDGRYSSATIRQGYLVAAEPPASGPAGCTMIVATSPDGKREISCRKNGCTEPCGLVTDIPAQGEVRIACHCNLAVPVGPQPNPPTPNPDPNPSPA